MAIVKAVFYLPITDNDGRDLSDAIDEAKANVYIQFGGWTSLGRVQGAYRMTDGNQALDTCKAYAVVLDESDIDDLIEILQDFKRKTIQAAIYLEIARDIEIRFV